MLGKMIDYFILFKAFNTPYPYMAIIGILLFILLVMGIFLKVQNGPVGWTFYIALICTGIWAFASLMPFDQPGTYPELDDKDVDVIGCSDRGIRVENGKLIMPAGIEIPKRYKRFYINPAEEMERVINNRKVRLEWHSEMDGYSVICDGGVDLGEDLVSKGFAKTASLASDSLRNLEKEARSNHLGIWARVRRGGPAFNDMFVAEYISIFVVSILIVCHFILLDLHKRSMDLD